MRIDHVADDAKLGKTVDQYNDRIEQHAATAVDIARPPNIPDDECATISVGTIATHAAGLESERLKHAQDAVVLARQRVELLEAIAVETKARADQADSAYDGVHSKTARALEKAGLGPAAQQAGKISPRIAERQFRYSVGQSVDVKAAEAEKRHQRGQLNHCIQLIAAAKASLADTQTELKTFVLQRINHDHDHERTANVAMRAVPQIEVPSRVSNPASHTKTEAAAAG